MLKGILFVIAIIVTFDIGKTLIDSYRAEQAQEKAAQSKQEQQVEGLKEEGEGEELEIDLSLPKDIVKDIEFGEEADTAPTHEGEEEGIGEPRVFNTSPKPDEQNKVSLSAKPLVDIDHEEKEADLKGASVGIKVDL